VETQLISALCLPGEERGKFTFTFALHRVKERAVPAFLSYSAPHHFVIHSISPT